MDANEVPHGWIEQLDRDPMGLLSECAKELTSDLWDGRYFRWTMTAGLLFTAYSLVDSDLHNMLMEWLVLAWIDQIFDLRELEHWELSIALLIICVILTVYFFLVCAALIMCALLGVFPYAAVSCRLTRMFSALFLRRDPTTVHQFDLNATSDLGSAAAASHRGVRDALILSQRSTSRKTKGRTCP